MGSLSGGARTADGGFPQTGRVSAEYCERPAASGQQTCREAGAFQQWTKKQSDDPVFKAYRKEYKKRFAWIKAGRITDEQFYAWSEQAREMKKEMRPGGHHPGRVQRLAGEAVEDESSENEQRGRAKRRVPCILCIGDAVFARATCA